MLAKTPDIGQQWFCLQANSREEMTARGWLIIRGFDPADIYLPMLWVTERHVRGGPVRFREVKKPMFPSYLFARCLPRADWLSRVRNLPGVVGFLGGEGPEPMPDAAIDAIRFTEACKATPEERKALRWPFSKGDKVRIKTGPFADFIAEINSAVDDRGRIMALIHLFERKTPKQFHADDLEKL